MLKLLAKVFFVIVIFSFLGFGEDFEKLCNEEVLKKDFNISVVKKICQKAGDNSVKRKKYENASWSYLLSGDLNQNINFIQKYIDDNKSLVIYPNIGHSYILQGKFEKTNKFYIAYIKKRTLPNIEIQADYKLLYKLYPTKNHYLNKGLKLWNKLYKPLIKLDKLYTKYSLAEEKENYELAIKYLEEIILLRENSYSSSLISVDYSNISLLYDLMGEQSKTLAYALKSLKISLEYKDLESIAISYSNLGYIYEKLSKYNDSEKSYFKALEIFKKLYQEDSTISTTYNNLGYLYSSKGTYEKALRYYQKALNMEKDILSENDILLAVSYNNIGEVQTILGNYPKALESYKKALEIDKYHNRENHTETASTYNNMGQLYEFIEDYKRSEYYYKKSLSILRNTFNIEHPRIAIAYGNLGNLYYSMEKYSDALDMQIKAFDIRKNIYKDEKHINMAISYHSLGTLYLEMEAYTIALEYFNKTLDIYKILLSPNNIANAITYSSIALLYEKQKNNKKALEFYLKTLELEKTYLGEEHRDIGRTYNSLSLLHHTLKNFQKAYIYSKKSFKISSKNRKQNFKILDRKQKKDYASKKFYKISNLLYLTQLNQKNIDLTFTINQWLNYKGTLFEYQNILSMLQNSPKTAKETKKTIKNLNSLNIQFSNLKKNKNQENIKQIEEQIHTVEIKLSKQNQDFQKLLDLQDINSSKIATHLEPHQLYIDFARANNNYYIFTLNHENDVTFQQIDENRTNLIDKNIEAYQTNTENMASMIDKARLTKVNRDNSKQEAQYILSKLYNNLIKEYLQKQLKETTHLIISPDGLLNYLPFEALYHKGKYFVEDYKINYISSGKEFVRQTKIKIKNPKIEMTIFANADFNATLKTYKPSLKEKTLAPLYNNQTILHSISQMKFSPLDDSEVIIIQKYYPKAKVYKDKNASVQNLMKVNSSKILHLSTHGLFLKDKKIINPMRKSVLVFAGGNQANLQGDQRGIISALKLSALNLKDTELVVLSACQSGLGDIHNAEGVIGLPKALLQAGAKNVMMSLWTVSTLKTAKLMDYFYANISKKQDYSTALQNAKITMSQMHPYYWSAFILSGI